MSEPLPGYDNWKTQEPSYLDGLRWCSCCEMRVEPIAGHCPICDKQLQDTD